MSTSDTLKMHEALTYIDEAITKLTKAEEIFNEVSNEALEHENWNLGYPETYLEAVGDALDKLEYIGV